MSIGNFALVIKRKTLLYSFCVIIVGLMSLLVFEYEFVMAPDGAFSTLDSQRLEMLQPDLSVKWDLFQSTFSNVSSYKRPTVINQMFHKDFAKKVV
jgi:hypothetical protein